VCQDLRVGPRLYLLGIPIVEELRQFSEPHRLARRTICLRADVSGAVAILWLAAAPPRLNEPPDGRFPPNRGELPRRI
jgi:hypothetical protein